MEEMFRGGNMSSHRSSWYWTPFFLGERVEAELSKLVEFPMVVLGYVIMKDLHQKSFLYSMMG
ncbi:hypothetical protein Tco_0589721, partial [Tanacetum coccineum]